MRGIVRVACGRADGLAQFGGTSQAFLASLAPLIAFPLVGSALVLLHGGGWPAISQLVATLCALIAPAVLSHEPARLWKREAEWLRFATALNWCQWVLPALATMLLILASPLLASGGSGPAALLGVMSALGGYGLWMHWFIARHGLRISALRAVALVLIVNIGTVLIVIGPTLLASSIGSLLKGAG